MSPSDRIHDASSPHAVSPDAVRPGQLRQLADDDVDRGARQEAGDDRAGEEPRDPAEAQHRQQEEQRAGHQRDRRHELGGLRALDPRDEHGAAGDGGQRRARPRRDVARRAEQRVDDRAGRRGVQPVLHRDARDAGVAQVLRHDHRRHGDPGEHVAAERAAVVARQPVHDGGDATDPAGGRAIAAVHGGDPPRPARRSRRRTARRRDRRAGHAAASRASSRRCARTAPSTLVSPSTAIPVTTASPGRSWSSSDDGARLAGRDHRGHDREPDRAAELERRAHEAGREALLVVGDAAGGGHVHRRVGEREAQPEQQHRGEDRDGVRRARVDRDEQRVAGHERQQPARDQRRGADARGQRAHARGAERHEQPGRQERERRLQRASSPAAPACRA